MKEQILSAGVVVVLRLVDLGAFGIEEGRAGDVAEGVLRPHQTVQAVVGVGEGVATLVRDAREIAIGVVVVGHSALG